VKTLTADGGQGGAGLRARLRVIVESDIFTRSIIVLIVINAALLGLETFPDVMASHGRFLMAADHVILGVFVVELALRMYAHGFRFLRDPWSWFDTIIVAIALVPASEAFSVLRAMRVLRVFRLISSLPQLKRVVQGLLSAIPGLSSIVGIMTIVLYVFAVMATQLYGEEFPDLFGGLHKSLFTLFQIMTMEGWADIVRDIQETHPYAWIFFITYILLSTFTVLNFFIAVIVDSMQQTHEIEVDHAQASLDAIQARVEALHRKVDQLSQRPPDGDNNRRGM